VTRRKQNTWGSLEGCRLNSHTQPGGLIVSSGMSIYGEKTGKDTVEGRANQSAKEIADVLKKRFQEQGWIN